MTIPAGEVHFVYLGAKLPKYASASIELAIRYSGLKVHLLGNKKIAPSVRHSATRFTAIEDFYDEQPFSETAARVAHSHSFRGGFWLKTLERFFVLSQYMNAAPLDSIFHAELDQLLFRADRLLDELARIDGSGLFLPFHSPEAAVASVFYCNDADMLQSLLDFSTAGDVFPSEMTLIARWAQHNPKQIFPLPTMASIANRGAVTHPPASRAIRSGQIGGVVDAAQLGQWVGGIDPRNVPIRDFPMTKFVDDPEDFLLTREQLKEFRFEFNPRDGGLLATYKNNLTLAVFNLHIHSKVHNNLLLSDPSLTNFFLQANQSGPARLAETRKFQIVDYLTRFIRLVFRNPQNLVSNSLALLRSHLNSHLKRRPSSSPFLSGDSFRSLANHVWEIGDESTQVEDVTAGDIIFCESESLERLNSQVLESLDVPIVLLLGNSDRNHASELLTALSGRNVSSVFAQNLTESVPGVSPLPIGLENAWHSKNGRPRDFRASRKKRKRRTFRVMWAFTMATNKLERTKAATALTGNTVADRFDALTPRKHRAALARYGFVASPPGNGLDTHRTWEAMYLSCVPIVLRSPMTELYEKIGLPVWVVESYAELSCLTESDLRGRYAEFIPKFDSDALWMSYWARKMQASGDDLR